MITADQCLSAIFPITKKRGSSRSLVRRFNPLTRIAVARCEFDRDAVLLSRGKVKRLLNHPGLEIVESGYIVFFPFKAAIFRNIEKYLDFIPLGAQHFSAGMKI